MCKPVLNRELPVVFTDKVWFVISVADGWNTVFYEVNFRFFDGCWKGYLLVCLPRSSQRSGMQSLSIFAFPAHRNLDWLSVKGLLLLVRISSVLVGKIGHTGRKYYTRHTCLGWNFIFLTQKDFTCHTYVRFSTKVVGVDLAKHTLLRRLRYHNLGAFVINATFHWQFVPITPVGRKDTGLSALYAGHLLTMTLCKEWLLPFFLGLEKAFHERDVCRDFKL